MIYAEFIKMMEEWIGDAQLYKLSEPIVYGGGETDHVVVSAAYAMGTGMETYIFPVNENGDVLDWGELPGSTRGTASHKVAIENAGWELALVVEQKE